MSLFQNAIYTGLFATGTIFYASTELSKKDMDDLILQVSMQQGNPYEEVIALNKIKEESISLQQSIGYTKIFMSNMDYWTDDQWLAKLLYTERSRPKCDEELRRIAATVIHRALMNGQTIKQVCQNKKQYSGVMRPKNKHWMTDPKRIHKEVAYDMLQQYKNGVPDEFKRMFFFCNMATVKKVGKKSTYKWFLTLNKIGESTHNGQTHTFFSCKPWDKYLKRNPDAKLTEKHLSNFPV